MNTNAAFVAGVQQGAASEMFKTELDTNRQHF